MMWFQEGWSQGFISAVIVVTVVVVAPLLAVLVLWLWFGRLQGASGMRVPRFVPLQTDGVWIADVIIQWWATAFPLDLPALLALRSRSSSTATPWRSGRPPCWSCAGSRGPLAVLLTAALMRSPNDGDPHLALRSSSLV